MNIWFPDEMLCFSLLVKTVNFWTTLLCYLFPSILPILNFLVHPYNWILRHYIYHELYLHHSTFHKLFMIWFQIPSSCQIVECWTPHKLRKYPKDNILLHQLSYCGKISERKTLKNDPDTQNKCQIMNSIGMQSIRLTWQQEFLSLCTNRLKTIPFFKIFSLFCDMIHIIIQNDRFYSHVLVLMIQFLDHSSSTDKGYPTAFFCY